MSEVFDKYRIRVEYQPMNPPKPMNFAVFKEQEIVAFLSEAQVREALAAFDAMKAAR